MEYVRFGSLPVFVARQPKVGQIPAQEPTARRPPPALKLSKFTAHRLKAVIGVVVPIGARLDAVEPSFEIAADAGYVVHGISLGTLLALLECVQAMVLSGNLLDLCDSAHEVGDFTR